MWVVIMKTKCKLWWSTVLSISTKRTITLKNATSYKRLCDNLHWIHLKTKGKKNMKYLGSGTPKWLVSVVSHLANVTCTWATSSLLLIYKTSLKIPKRKSEFINRRRTENTMVRRQRTNNGLHKSSPKSALSVLEQLFSPYNDELSV